MGALLLIVIALVALFLVYQKLLQPARPGVDSLVPVSVKSGDSVAVIGQKLQSAKVIQNATAFGVFYRLSGGGQQLKAGSYSLSPSLGVAQIVQQLIKGQTKQVSVTIVPGTTLKQIKSSLLRLGYTSAHIERAFGKTYQHPLLSSKPAGATLEGYIYPETYTVEHGAELEQLLGTSFDIFYETLQKNNFITAYMARGLTIHQALTLASIIQREVPGRQDQLQVAQVFYKRLASGIPLGADATFIYAAELAGIQPSVAIDSPYNTRRVVGLPPGPIGNATLPTLQAVATPAGGDFLYFVSGDDGTTYFARSEQEHQANIDAYCIQNCALF